MMAARIDRDQAKQVLETCNPLGLIDINKRLIIFGSPSECYYQLLTLLSAHCPRGWIDIPFMMAKLQGLRIARARDFCGRKHYAVVEWNCKPNSSAAQYRNRKLKAVIIQMLRATGITFSENAFNMAIYEYDRTFNKFCSDLTDEELEDTKVRFANKLTKETKLV